MYEVPEEENDNYFRGEVGTPYHLSVGAVVVNEKNQILTHYFKRSPIHDLDDIYILMRETIQPGETIEHALERGLKEEFGVQAPLESFIGTIVSTFPGTTQTVEKTTLYFICRYKKNLFGGRPNIDGESTSQPLWLTTDDLSKKMHEQGVRTGRTDLDESLIVERAQKLLTEKH